MFSHVSALGARPSSKDAKLKGAANVTSGHKPEVQFQTSTSTSTKTAPSAPASGGVTIAMSPPPQPESVTTTRAEVPRTTNSQP